MILELLNWIADTLDEIERSHGAKVRMVTVAPVIERSVQAARTQVDSGLRWKDVTFRSQAGRRWQQVGFHLDNRRGAVVDVTWQPGSWEPRDLCEAGLEVFRTHRGGVLHDFHVASLARHLAPHLGGEHDSSLVGVAFQLATGGELSPEECADVARAAVA